MIDRTIYYTDEENEDFAATHGRIRTRSVDEHYRYRRKNPVFRLFSFLLYRLVALPLIFLYLKFRFGLRVKNRRAVRRLHGGYFLYGKLHGSRREELSFFDIDNFPCLGSSYQQVRLPAEESRDLQDIYILGSHCCFSCFVNIGYSRNTERVAYPAEYFQCFLIANACERIQPRTVGFPV